MYYLNITFYPRTVFFYYTFLVKKTQTVKKDLINPHFLWGFFTLFGEHLKNGQQTPIYQSKINELKSSLLRNNGVKVQFI